MKFSELVRIRENLTNAYDTALIASGTTELESKLNIIGNEVDVVEFRQGIVDLASDLNRIHTNLRFNQDRFKELINQLNQRIQIESTKFLTDNYSLELRVESEAVANIRKVRVMDISPALEEEILNRIRLYTDWKYPALEIGCRDGEWTRHLVAADPLYVTDHYRDFTEAAVNQFTEEYARRVRAYLTRDTDLSVLPQAQFGFVFCWNFLNYRSFDTVKEYLKSVKELLRPGGVFMFSYNNGDIPEAAGYAEGFWMSYIPKSMLVPMCESLGYEVITARDTRGEGTAISWLELKKSGTLETIKAHQVMGEIKSINN